MQGPIFPKGEIFLILLEANNIKKFYGERLLFELSEIKIYSGDRIGIVGLNGSGKTTLMNILAGELSPDEGNCRRYTEISYIRQFSDESASGSGQLNSEFSVKKRDVRELSGGEAARIRLANAFSKRNAFLFADEPTSNLDSEGINLLHEKLSAQQSLVIISHDEALLRHHCNRIIEISNSKIRIFNIGYDSFAAQNALIRKSLQAEYDSYAAEKKRLNKAVQRANQRASTVLKTPKRMGNSEARLHRRSSGKAQGKIANAAHSIQTRIEKLEAKEKPRDLPPIRLDFSLTNPPENKIVISARKLNFGYSEALFENCDFTVKNRSKTAVLGDNGVGKTTLLNLIANADPSIYTVPKLKLGYFHQKFEGLHVGLSVLENVKIQSVQSESAVRAVLARLLFRGDEVHKAANTLSGGEKVRLSLAMMLCSGCNMLILDEPTNYLDIDSINAVRNLLTDYEGTVLFVSHQKSFVQEIADSLLIIRDKKITAFSGSLSDYELEQAKSKKSGEFMLLEMKIARLLSELSMKNADKEKLQLEFEELLSEKRKLIN